MTRDEIIKLLEDIALLPEMKGDNPFKSRAYQHAAQVIGILEEDFDDPVRSDRLATVKGIAEAINKKIREYLETGRASRHRPGRNKGNS